VKRQINLAEMLITILSRGKARACVVKLKVGHDWSVTAAHVAADFFNRYECERMHKG